MISAATASTDPCARIPTSKMKTTGMTQLVQPEQQARTAIDEVGAGHLLDVSKFQQVMKSNSRKGQR